MQRKKTVIINRAVPSSGKSTMSNVINKALVGAGYSVKIHSTDEYFIFGDKYVFDISKLNENHQKNLKSFENSLAKNEDFVICDNINILPWQSEAYTTCARKYAYRIIFINYFPRDLESHIQGQKVSLERPDAHGVPKECLEKFIEDFYLYNSLLDKAKPIDPTKHFDYKWDFSKNIPLKSGVAKRFDFDYLINIKAIDFNLKKENIAKEILIYNEK